MVQPDLGPSVHLRGMVAAKSYTGLTWVLCAGQRKAVLIQTSSSVWQDKEAELGRTW